MPAVALAAVAAVGAWRAVVPWDLSEIDANGQLIPSGGADANAGRIAFAACVVVLVGFVLAAIPAARSSAVAATRAGMTVWAALFTWRALAARTEGASLFLVPLVFVVAPAVLIGPLIVRRVVRTIDHARGA